MKDQVYAVQLREVEYFKFMVKRASISFKNDMELCQSICGSFANRCQMCFHTEDAPFEHLLSSSIFFCRSFPFFLVVLVSPYPKQLKKCSFNREQNSTGLDEKTGHLSLYHSFKKISFVGSTNSGNIQFSRWCATFGPPCAQFCIWSISPVIVSFCLSSDSSWPWTGTPSTEFCSGIHELSSDV